MIKTAAKRIIPLPIWTRLRVARIRYDLWRYQQHVVRHLYGGVPLDICLRDQMAQGWYDFDWPEPPEFELLRTHCLHPGAKVFNLGAHQCVVALMLAKIVEETGLVVALEPNPHNAQSARINRELNHAGQLEVIEGAVAASAGTLAFSKALNGAVDAGSGEWGSSVVACVSIDDLAACYGVPDVLYIDVEGYEAKALEGATRTLQGRPDVFVEVHVGFGLEDYGYSGQSILSFFPTEIYRLFVATQSERIFHPLAADGSVPKERFFLVALSDRP